MANPIVKNYRLILKNETRRAESIATSVLGIRSITVWEVLVPVLFIMGFIQSRQRRDLFAQNLMFTKNTALKGARDMRLKDLSREAILAAFDSQTDEILQNDEAGVYSTDIQHLQRREIDLLLDHYLGLLDARGNGYEALIRAAYPQKAQYEHFIQSLMAMEEKVMAAAKATLGKQADRTTLTRLREVTKTAYLKQADRLYSPIEADQP